jgi:hypothetical protein
MPVLLVMLFTLSLSLPVAAGAAPGTTIAVIVAPEGPDLEFGRSGLKNIFLKRTLIDRSGHLLVPVNLDPEHPLRRAFSKEVLDRRPEQLQQYWNRRYFHGVSPPYVLTSQEAVVRFVATTPGGIGYVADCYVDDRVKVVLRIPATGLDASVLHGLCPAGGH